MQNPGALAAGLPTAPYIPTFLPGRGRGLLSLDDLEGFFLIVDGSLQALAGGFGVCRAIARTGVLLLLESLQPGKLCFYLVDAKLGSGGMLGDIQVGKRTGIRRRTPAAGRGGNHLDRRSRTGRG